MAATSTIRNLLVKIGVDTGNFQKGMTSAGSQLSALGKKMEATGKTLTKAFTLPIIAAGVAIAKVGMEAEESFAKVGTIADQTKVNMDQFRDSVLKLSSATGAAVTEINEALYETISSGVDTADALGVVETAIKAAKGGFTDTMTAVDGLTSVLNAYNMEVSETESLANKFFIAQDKGKTTFGELAQSIGGVASIAFNAGVSIDDLLSTIAGLTINGIDTAEAVTGLKTAIVSVINPSAEAAEIAKRLGIDFSATALQSKGLAVFLRDVAEKTGRSSETMSELFGNVRGMNAVLALTSEGGMAMMNETLGAMTTNTTALDNAFSSMTNTSSFQLKSAFNELKNAGIQAFEYISPVVTNTVVPALKSLAETIGRLFKWYGDLNPASQKFVNTMLVTAVAIGPVAIGVGKIVSGAGRMIKAFGDISKSIKGGAGLIKTLTSFSSSAGLVVAAIAAVAVVIGGLIAAMGSASSKTTELKKELNELKDSIERAKKEFDSQITSINSNAGAARKLADDLYNLAAKENKTNSEKQQMKTLIEQLNKIYPELNLQIDEQTGLLNAQYETVQGLIEAKKQEIVFNAYAERYTELIKEEIALKEQLEEAQANYNTTYAEYQRLLASMTSDTTMDVSIAYENFLAAQAVLEDTTSAFDANVAAQSGMSAQMEATAEAAWLASETIAEASGDAADAVRDSTEEMTKAYSEWLAEYEKKQDKYLSILTDTTKIKKSKMSAKTLLDIWKSDTKTLKAWNDDLVALAGRVPDAMLEYLRGLGPEYAKVIKGLVATDDLTDAIATWQDIIKTKTDVAYDDVGKSPYANALLNAPGYGIFAGEAEKAEKSGEEVTKRFATGIESATGQVTSTAKRIGETAVAAMKKAMNVKFRLTAVSAGTTLGADAFHAMGAIRMHAKGVILTRPTILNNLDVGGEAGAEALLPLDQHTEWMDDVADRVVARMGEAQNINLTSKTYVQLDGRIAAVSTTKQQQIINLVKGVVVNA